MSEAAVLQSLDAGGREDAIRQAMQRLRNRLRRATDDPVGLELLEDDLREGLQSVDEVQTFFNEVLVLLLRSDTRSVDFLERANDGSVLERLDYLTVVVNNLRRRLVQLAGPNAGT